MKDTTKGVRKQRDIRTLQQDLERLSIFFCALGIVSVVCACVYGWALKTPDEKQQYRDKSTYTDSDVCMNGILHLKDGVYLIIQMGLNDQPVLCDE